MTVDDVPYGCRWEDESKERDGDDRVGDRRDEHKIDRLREVI